jgi:hypothetical protein
MYIDIYMYIYIYMYVYMYIALGVHAAVLMEITDVSNAMLDFRVPHSAK